MQQVCTRDAGDITGSFIIYVYTVLTMIMAIELGT
jgi:hypothetical protein